jgi:hypothetical protein
VDKVVQKLNSRPRKCLGFKKSSDEFDFCSVVFLNLPGEEIIKNTF